MEKSSTNPLSTVSNHSRLSEKRVERLEDYLDSNLLSAISARIGLKREKVGERKMREKEIAFDWPADELKALDLTEDNGVINGVEEEEKEEEEEAVCDLFGRFEETALKRLRA